jgi:translation initiation factor IF-2
MTNADKAIRLSKLAREFNIGISTLIDFLSKKGHKVENNPNTKVDVNLYDLLVKEFGAEISLKQESKKVSMINLREKKESVSIEDLPESVSDEEDNDSGEDEVIVKNVTPEKETFKTEKPQINITVKGKIDIEPKPKKVEPQEEKVVEEEKKEEVIEQPIIKKEPVKPPIEHIETETQRLAQPKVVGKLDLPVQPKKKITKKADRVEPKADKPQQQKDQSKRHPSHEKAVDQRHKTTPRVEQKVEQKTEPVELPKVEKQEVKFFRSEVEKLTGPTVVGRIDLASVEPKKKVVPAQSQSATAAENGKSKKKRRKRIRKDNQKVPVSSDAPKTGPTQPKQPSTGAAQLTKKGAGAPKKKRQLRQEVSEEDVQKQIKETLARLTNKGGKSKGSKYRREKRDLVSARHQQELEREMEDKQILKVTEFVSANELANMIDVPATEVIEVCMNLGLMVSINQRLDAETMAMVADEFGYKVEFVSIELQEAIGVEEDKPEDLTSRSPIVTVMGHVDHGKTSLLDFIRKANVIAGEAGGITQHIGAYAVEVQGGKQITFLDTPGHEAFTAMRARGARVTDVAIIVVSADDNVMPQTIEAINHASAAGVPIVFAINKIDRPNANPEKIKESLANLNYLVEEWGGKYQSQDISAKSGTNIDKLLEKVLLEAELLDLKANPKKKAVGTIIESSLDKGRGYTATVLVQAGTLRQGDIMIAGTYFGHVKAMFNERGKRITEAGPSAPVQVVGLNGAPLAGDYFNIMGSDKEAKEIANKREQLQRMQGLRAHKHITLDEIGRRIAIGNFQELNIVIKGDVDGSIEALSDSLIKLSTEQIQVNVIHKAVGQISESDILLAAASNAIVIGFQVRPSVGARKLAEKEEIDIRMYSIIYDAINEVKAAMEGMLSPEIKEEILGTAEVVETFKITKVGTVAGCIVREGKILRNAKCRLIRDGIVAYTGDLGSLKRFKDDTREVANGFECGLNINNFNDIKVGDLVESFQEVEVKRKL